MYVHPFTVSNALREISNHILSVQILSQQITSGEDESLVLSNIARIKENKVATLALFDVVIEGFLGDKSEIRITRDEFSKWVSEKHKIISQLPHKNQSKINRTIHEDGALPIESLNKRIMSHIEYAKNKANHFRTKATQQANDSMTVLLLLTVLVLVIGLFAFVFIFRYYDRHEKEVASYIDSIRQSENKFRALLDAAPDAVLVVGSNRTIHIVNDGAQRMFGYEKHELVGQKVELLMPMESRHNHEHKVGGFFKKPTNRLMSDGMRLKALHKDGHSFPVTIRSQ